jgi:hypothetical protein
MGVDGGCSIVFELSWVLAWFPALRVDCFGVGGFE